jgi:hypothetical protein
MGRQETSHRGKMADDEAQSVPNPRTWQPQFDQQRSQPPRLICWKGTFGVMVSLCTPSPGRA